MQPLQPSATNGPVTDTERAYAIDVLTNTKDVLRTAVADLSTEQLAYKPAPDRWSIDECVEHIALVEAGIFSAIRAGMGKAADPDRRAEIRCDDLYVVKAVRSRSTRLPAPDPFVPTGRFGNVAMALQAFEQQRDAAIDFVSNPPGDLRTHYFRHFVLGLLDCYQATLLLASHSERHRKQIEEVKADAGFPR